MDISVGWRQWIKCWLACQSEMLGNFHPLAARNLYHISPSFVHFSNPVIQTVILDLDNTQYVWQGRWFSCRVCSDHYFDTIFWCMYLKNCQCSCTYLAFNLWCIAQINDKLNTYNSLLEAFTDKQNREKRPGIDMVPEYEGIRRLETHCFYYIVPL